MSRHQQYTYSANDTTRVTITHTVTVMSTQAPIGGAPGRMLRIGITAKTIAAIQPSMSVCTTRRRRAVWIDTNAASAARITIIANSSAE